MHSIRRNSGILGAVMLALLLVSCRDSTGPRGDPCTTTVGSVAVGQSRSAQLTTSACQLPDGSYADRWRLVLTAETAIQIDMTSTEFDTYLLVQDADEQFVAADDDGGMGTNSRIFHLFDPGEYVILANGFDQSATGQYQLSLTSAANHPCVTFAGMIAEGQTVTGSLAAGDCQIFDETYVDRWRLEITTAASLQIDMMSTAFNAYLAVSDASGTFVAEDDDSGEGTNARITRSFWPGIYTIWANSYAPATGPYSLSVQAMSVASHDGPAVGGLSHWRGDPDGNVFDAVKSRGSSSSPLHKAFSRNRD